VLVVVVVAAGERRHADHILPFVCSAFEVARPRVSHYNERKTKATRTNKSFIGVLWSAWNDGVGAHWVELIALEVEATISSFTDLGPPQTRFTRSCVRPKSLFE
jgi:hypothetical protein